VIDKLDLRIPRRAAFTKKFGCLYSELQALEKGPFRPAKYYEYAGDLREYGFNVRLNLYCQMEKVGNHKLELIDVGTMSRADICAEVSSIFEINPASLGIMRIDFAVDIPNVPVQWFRETVGVKHKRYRAAVTGQPFYSEMGNGNIETLYFGKRPNLIRIYDKKAEYEAQFRKIIRKHSKEGEPLSFESAMGFSKPDSNLTRVERQFGGRIPVELATLGNVCSKDFDYNPFAILKIIDHATLPEQDLNVTFEAKCTSRFLRSMAVNDGMQAVRTFISRESNGNGSKVWKKYGAFLPSASSECGLNEAGLHTRFAQSLAHQMSL
jgi:hypothetical protein